MQEPVTINNCELCLCKIGIKHYVLYSLIRNKQETMIGTMQWTSMKTPVRMFPISAPDLPNIVPIDVAMPLRI